MKKLLMVLMLGIALVLMGCDDKSDSSNAPAVSEKVPVKISIESKYQYLGSLKSSWYDLRVTSLEDGLTIKSIVVDRNNCGAYGKPGTNKIKPTTFKFGGWISLLYNSNCGFNEIVVETSKGTWVFS